MIQVTLIQIDNYGPWTVTPQPKREADLQILQSSLYTNLQKEFSQKKAIVFPSRQDNLIAVTNDLGEEDHREIQEKINAEYPVTVSMSVAAAETALEAQARATGLLANHGSAQSAERKSILHMGHLSSGEVQMAHIDVDHVTRHTDKDVYHSYGFVMKVYARLIDLLGEKEAMVFFMGGDNFISPSNRLAKEDFLEAFDKIETEVGAALKAGVGSDSNAEDAVKKSSHALKEVREDRGRRIVFF